MATNLCCTRLALKDAGRNKGKAIFKEIKFTIRQKMFSDDELTSCFNIHLKYRDDDGKYWNQLKKLESAPKEISEWPRKTILHFSMIVATQEYWTVELRQRPRAWEYWTGEVPQEIQAWAYQPERMMHRQQFLGYQSKDLLHRSLVGGYQEKMFMLASQPWEYQARVVQRRQAFGYQAGDIMHWPHGKGNKPEECMQRMQIALNCNEISLFPSGTYFPSLKGKFRSKQSRGANMQENHAEHLLIDKLYVYFSVLEKELKILRDINGHFLKVKLELTQNYSPCKDCVAKIIEFQSICRNRYQCDIDISLTFATFYQFYKFHRFDYGVIFEDYRNKEGLVSLQKSGVQLNLIDDRLREKIKTLLVEKYKVPEETMKTWLQERKLWDEFYMRKIKNESNIFLSPFIPNFSQYSLFQ
ncbi:hypothetical protein CHS0354_036305 [Potamilus streckersoni]|uniref:Activation-induced cytidine deaminase AID domain-containing protein n=1 Tax=Potamilus streckersoni TaxID=2493646 RepID=A0AAE0T7S8_9BIVA|nr:hypothetical protein CHS0354_036305 [Potamilus streckersoni]